MPISCCLTALRPTTSERATRATLENARANLPSVSIYGSNRGFRCESVWQMWPLCLGQPNLGLERKWGNVKLGRLSGPCRRLPILGLPLVAPSIKQLFSLDSDAMDLEA